MSEIFGVAGVVLFCAGLVVFDLRRQMDVSDRTATALALVCLGCVSMGIGIGAAL